jgi:hypothetical protein
MRRTMIVLGCVLALAVGGVPPASAATPVSVVGLGKVQVQVCTLSGGCKFSPKSIVLTTASNAGVLHVPGVFTGPIVCVRSAVRNGVKGVIAASRPANGRIRWVAINEGGGPNLRRPWAIVFDWPLGWSGTGGDCKTGFTAARMASEFHPFYVSPAQFTVLGGG